jgi:Mycoplasma protein of unknown function, DUF285
MYNNQICGFFDSEILNQDIKAFDVSNSVHITNMSCFIVMMIYVFKVTLPGLLYCAKSFNQDISPCHLKNVRNMGFMLARAAVFNQSLSSWDVLYDETMDVMFTNSQAFNQTVCKWNVKKVKNMKDIFNRLLHAVKIYSPGTYPL